MFDCSKSFLLLALLLAGARVHADEDMILSQKSMDKIHSDEFIKHKKTFAESPSLFKGNSNFNIPHTIAFEDLQGTIRLTPSDVIKISEDLTFSDWGGSSSQVAEEDFTLDKNGQSKKANKASSIDFSN